MPPDGIPPTLRGLVGRWVGSGEGTWPSSGGFSFDEEMVFEDGGGGPDFPFIAYEERAWDPVSGLTLHSERGFWVAEGSAVSASLSHPIGVNEIAEGRLDGDAIELSATRLERTASGLVVTGYRRRYSVDGDRLSYEQFLATERDREPALHVWASLKRS